jgi:hypothetical protein
LCGDAISKEVIQALFAAFHGQNGNSRSAVSYCDFIDWLFESLEPAGGAGSALVDGLSRSMTSSATVKTEHGNNITPSRAGTWRLFCSHQHTQEATAIRAAWLPGRGESIKVSAPPFNTRLDKQWLPEDSVSFNIATYGARLPRVIMKIYETESMKELAKALQIPVPHYSLDNFVQKKMAKVQDMINKARDADFNLDAKNLEAVDKLEKFCKDFENLDKPGGLQITGPDAWDEFVSGHVRSGWEDHLHFEVVLVECFGFDKEVSDRLRTATIPVTEKGKTTDVAFEHHALRWLTKAFKGYGPVGCLTDVVNMLYAIMNLPEPTEASERNVIDVVEQFENRLKQGDLSGLWIPTHFAHDAESDDCLSWLLLEYIHNLQKTQLEVLVQLSNHPDQQPENMDLIVSKSHPVAPRMQVFRDHDSGNGKPVFQTWQKMIPQG